ncbi:histidine kinase [Hamadaea sp. NPDC051192]|uniref:sensor histidine kinase n=1 Tax=Hamadaea sp. NPDC051192 TaxID=3154940 RepID=UPI003444EAD1
MGTRSVLAAYRPSAWGVERIIGTVMLVAAPLTARTPLTAGAWAAVGTGLAGWLGFLALDGRRPVAGLAVLAGATLVTAQAMAMTDDGTGVIMVCVALAGFATHTRPTPAVILTVAVAALGSAALGQWLRERPITDLGSDAAVVLIVVVLGLVRRDYRVKADHARLLLAQAEEARREHARAAALDERTRIARELHDVLAHSLGSLAIQLEVADALLTRRSDVDDALARVRRARRLAIDGLAEARTAVAALREDVPPLADALERLAAEHSGGGANPVSLTVSGVVRVPAADASVALLGVAREALTNAGKHAPGAEVTVALDYLTATVRLTVHNKPVEAPRADGGGPSGYGLTGMAERLALAGGRLSAGPGDSGWQVTAEVPG